MLGSVYLKRRLESEVLELAQFFPAVVIIGPRQVGKTSLTLAIRNQIDSSSFYLDLERPEDLAAISNLEQYAEHNLDSLIIIDEIQRKPELFPELRSVIDRNRQAGRFILLGSASLDLIRDASESLAGRIAIVELTGLQYEEVQEVTDLNTHWLRGGFPDAVLAPSDKLASRWHTFFLKTYFERDLRALGLDADPVLIRRLLTMLSHWSGQLLNVDQLANSLGISWRLTKRYLNYLEQTFLIRNLPPYFSNLKKRMVKSPKVYLRDTGVLHHLQGITTFNELLSNPIIGQSWETYVVEQVLSRLPTGYEAYFYRTAAGAELDLIICKAGIPTFAFEIKNSPNPKLTKGFYTALADLNLSTAFVVCPIKGDRFWLNDSAEVIGVHHLDRIF